MAGREETEAKREKELVALRKKYLAKKAKDKKNKKPAAKKKVVRLDLSREGVEASRLKKLDAILAKSKKGVSKSKIPKARPIISVSTTTVTKSVVPKVKKFKEEVKKIQKEEVKLNKELTKAKKETDSDRIKAINKKMKTNRLAFKKKQRQGKGYGFRISGAGDDLDFIVKMLEK